MRAIRLAVALVLGLLGLLGLVGPAFAQEPSGPVVLVTTVDGPITPVIANHLTDALQRAEQGRYEALVVRLDTPGGLDTSMRKIIQRFLASEVPVVVHVSPPGARAGSAGALITLSAHVAAMAPGTAIGASTPVSLEGGEVADKVVNDAAAFAEAIAELRARNVEVAIDMVREGRSLASEDALELNVVDVIEETLPDLLDAIDGQRVDIGTDGRTATIESAGAMIEEYEMTLFRRLQQALADPNLAFLFLSLGTLGIIYELATPGVGAGGVVGVSFILLALFSLSVLPVSAVGLLFLVLAAAMFVAELFAPGVGIAAAGGSGALVLSGIFLVRDVPGFEVSLAVVAPVAAVVFGAVIVAGQLVRRSSREPTRFSGPGVLLGKVGHVRQAPSGRSQAFIDGAWWTVRSAGPELTDGDIVRVVELDGLDVVVERVEDRATESEGLERHG